MAKKKASSRPQGSEQITVVSAPIEHQELDTPVPAANHMLVQADQHEFHISFYQVCAPTLLGTPEEQLKKAKSIKSIRALCVARVTIAEGRMPGIIKALAENYERQRSLKEKPNTSSPSSKNSGNGKGS